MREEGLRCVQEGGRKEIWRKPTPSILHPTRERISHVLIPLFPSGTNEVINQSHSPTERGKRGPEANRERSWGVQKHSENTGWLFCGGALQRSSRQLIVSACSLHISLCQHLQVKITQQHFTARTFRTCSNTFTYFIHLLQMSYLRFIIVIN